MIYNTNIHSKATPESHLKSVFALMNFLKLFSFSLEGCSFTWSCVQSRMSRFKTAVDFKNIGNLTECQSIVEKLKSLNLLSIQFNTTDNVCSAMNFYPQTKNAAPNMTYCRLGEKMSELCVYNNAT